MIISNTRSGRCASVLAIIENRCPYVEETLLTLWRNPAYMRYWFLLLDLWLQRPSVGSEKLTMVNYRTIIVFTISLLAGSCFGILPDSITNNVGDIDADGMDEVLILTKRSVRSATGYKLMTWDSTNGYVEITAPEVRTYRGYVQDDPDMRVNAEIEPGNTLMNANLSDGHSLNYQLENLPVTVSGPEGTADPGTGNTVVPLVAARTAPTANHYIVPIYNMRRLDCAVTIDETYLASLGSIEAAVSNVEQRYNDADFFYARDMGLAWEIGWCVVYLEANTDNWYNEWYYVHRPEGAVFEIPQRFKSAGGAASSGDVFISARPWHTVGATAPYAKSLGHEFAHNLGAGHWSSWGDVMSGSESSLGSGTVERMIGNAHVATESQSPGLVYGSPLPPFAMEDCATMLMNTTLDIDVLENDYDGNGDAISISYVDAATQKGGTAEIVAGKVRYTPPPRWQGVDEFSYHVQDASGLANRTGYVKVSVHNKGLATHILFDETSGTTAHDVGPFQAHGTLDYGMSFSNSVAGKVGNAMEWTTNDNVKASADFWGTGDPLDGSLGVSLWVKYPSVPSASGVVIAKGGAVIPGRFGSSRGGWCIGHTSGGTLRFEGNLNRDSEYTYPNAEFDLETDVPVTPGTWHHLAMSMDRSNQLLRAWVDGVELASTTHGTTIADGVIDNSHHPLVIFDSVSQQEQGTDSPVAVDDVRIYTRALSAADVAELHTNPVADIPAGSPFPEHGGEVAQSVVDLSWMPGKPATYDFDVYFGTNYAAVAAATTHSAEYQGRQDSETNSQSVVPATSYYWRIDEVNGSSVIPGSVWRFSTAIPGGHYRLDFGTSSGAVESGFTGVPYNTETYVNWAPFTLASSAGGSVSMLQNGGNGDLLNDYIVNDQSGGSLVLTFSGVESGEYFLKFHQWLSNTYNVPEKALLREQGGTTLVDFGSNNKSLAPYETNVVLNAGNTYEFVVKDNNNVNKAYIAGFELVSTSASNAPPVFSDHSIDGAGATQDVAYAETIAGSATDEDGDTLAYSKVSGPSWLAVGAQGALSGTPDATDVGVSVFTVQVSDGNGGGDLATLNIEVANINDPPVFTVDPIVGGAAAEYTTYSEIIAGNAYDEDGDPLTYSKISGPAWLSVAADGTLSGTPSSSDEGANVFLVQVSDGNGGGDSATLNIVVAGLFDPPIVNGSFEDPELASGASDNDIKDWYDAVAYTYTKDDAGGAGSYPDSPDGDNWAEMDRLRWMYQQIGTYTDNRDIKIDFLLGKRSGNLSHDLYVALYAGGDPNLAVDANVKLDAGHPLVDTVGAMQVAQSALISGATDAVPVEHSVTLSTGTGFPIGTPLWIEFSFTSQTGRKTLIDHVRISDVSDADADGMPDLWEYAYFNEGVSASSAANADRDSHNNLDEYIAGTDPTNAASHFRVTNHDSGTSGFTIEWPSVEGRLYVVGWTDSLTNSFLPLAENLEFPVNSHTDTNHPAEARGFYRVDVRLK